MGLRPEEEEQETLARRRERAPRNGKGLGWTSEESYGAAKEGEEEKFFY
jgi:hypothetical protein